MKTIKIKFVDFWQGFDPKDNLIYKILDEKYEIQLTDKPDYIFYSVLGYEHLDYDCIRIFYTGECLAPDFNVCDYGIGFDLLSYGDRYLRFPYFAWSFWRWGPFGDEIIYQRTYTEVELRNKTKFCNFVYSNGNANSFREDLMNKINSYKLVDSGGGYKNNIGKQVEKKEEFLKSYKFTIACENSMYPGYTTEKLLQAFQAHTIPIYWGDPKVTDEFNSKAFINCHDYNSFANILDRIKEIDKNDKLFVEMLKEPIFCKPYCLKEYKNNLEDFLQHIFEMPYNQAFRRNRTYWGEKYEKELKSVKKTRKFLAQLFNFLPLFVKKFISTSMNK